MKTNTSFHYRSKASSPWVCMTYNINFKKAQDFLVKMEAEAVEHHTTGGDVSVTYQLPDGKQIKLVDHMLSQMDTPVCEERI